MAISTLDVVTRMRHQADIIRRVILANKLPGYLQRDLAEALKVADETAADLTAQTGFATAPTLAATPAAAYYPEGGAPICPRCGSAHNATECPAPASPADWSGLTLAQVSPGSADPAPADPVAVPGRVPLNPPPGYYDRIAGNRGDERDQT